MSYNYKVNVLDVNGTETGQIDSGRIFLSDNETTTVFEKFTMAAHFDRAEIVVNVLKDNLNITPDFMKKLWWPDPNYPTAIDIHFWIDEYVPTTARIIHENNSG
jgi:hypothetical protein